MACIAECIPNFSEGRNAAVLQALAEAAQSVPGVLLLHQTADESHNRSVYTLAGAPQALAEAVFGMCRIAAQRIDLTKHRGEHPRMGAVDVLPFVPLAGLAMADCVALSRTVGLRIGQELGVPVFLYEGSATAENRRNLADIRRGGFEGMAAKMARPGWQPDFGPPAPHPTAGAAAVGARAPLVAFNVNLDTGDVSIAKAIAKKLRASGGGLPYCKAIGVMLHHKGLAQVSMNLVNHAATPVWQAYEAVKAEAAALGVGVAGSELIGLAPAAALAGCGARYLQLEDFDAELRLIEPLLLAGFSGAE